MKKVVLGYDHKAVELGENAEKILQQLGFEVINVGAESADTRLPLEELIPAFVTKFNEGQVEFGVISCGTGVGVEIGVNKFKGVRGSLCHNQEQVKLAREYDDANVLALASWDELDLGSLLKTWVETEYDGNEKRRKMLGIINSWGA